MVLDFKIVMSSRNDHFCLWHITIDEDGPPFTCFYIFSLGLTGFII